MVLMLLGPDINTLEDSSRLDPLKADTSDILRAGSGAERCVVNAIQQGSLVLGLACMAQDQSQVIPMYLGMKELLDDTQQHFKVWT